MCESAYCLYLIYLCAVHTFLNFSKACDFQEIFKNVNNMRKPLMNCKCAALFSVSEWYKEKLRSPAVLPVSHVTLINISQLARMVCYLNLMNFWTEWYASNWQSVIKQNRREYKSPEKPKGEKKQKGRKKHGTSCAAKVPGRHLCAEVRLCGDPHVCGRPPTASCEMPRIWLKGPGASGF